MFVLQALQGDDGFLSPQRLKNYNSMRNDPCSPKAVSTLSAYLHFGQISAQRVAFEASKHRSKYKVKPPVRCTHYIAGSLAWLASQCTQYVVSEHIQLS